MRKLFVVIGVLVLLVVLELAARGCTDNRLASSIHSKSDHVGKVTVASGDIPLLWNEYARGYLSNGSITMYDIVSSPISVAQLRVSSAKLKVGRSAMLSGQAKITGSAPYSIMVVLSAANISHYLGTPVSFHGSDMRIDSIDTNITAAPALHGRTIVFSSDGATEPVPLPSSDILPCTPTNVSAQGALVTGCTSNTLPKVLADAVR